MFPPPNRSRGYWFGRRRVLDLVGGLRGVRRVVVAHRLATKMVGRLVALANGTVGERGDAHGCVAVGRGFVELVVDECVLWVVLPRVQVSVGFRANHFCAVLAVVFGVLCLFIGTPVMGVVGECIGGTRLDARLDSAFAKEGEDEHKECDSADDTRPLTGCRWRHGAALGQHVHRGEHTEHTNDDARENRLKVAVHLWWVVDDNFDYRQCYLMREEKKFISFRMTVSTNCFTTVSRHL